MDSTTDRMRRVARGSALWRLWWAVWLLWGLALLATGCGGTDEDEDTDNRPVVCRDNPRACI